MIAGGLPTIARRLLDVSLERRANWRDGSDFPGNGRLGDAGGALIGGQSSQVTCLRGEMVRATPTDAFSSPYTDRLKPGRVELYATRA